jgi:hypothetical protein
MADFHTDNVDAELVPVQTWDRATVYSDRSSNIEQLLLKPFLVKNKKMLML